MFHKSPGNLFNAVFNAPQGLVMTLAVSFFQGIFDPAALAVTFVKAYCAGVMLSCFLQLGKMGAWVSQKSGASRNRVADYLASGTTAGLIMGFLMNLFMTFMAIGPVPYFFAAYLRTLPVALIASAISANLWTGPVTALVHSVYREKQESMAQS